MTHHFFCRPQAFEQLCTKLGTTPEALLANTPLMLAVLSYHVTGMRTFRSLASFGRGSTITLATLARGKSFSTVSEWVACC